LGPSIRYYQRLLAGDVDEATEIVEEFRKEQTLLETFDQVLLPALAQAERDREHGDISETHQELIWKTTEQLVDELAGEPTASAETDPTVTARTPLVVVGVPILDRGDELALKMLVRMAPAHVRIEITPIVMLTGELLSNLETNQADIVCISALGPGGVGQVRYACKRIRLNFAILPILVGRWDYHGNTEKMIANTKERGATYVFTRLAAALETLASLHPNRLPPIAAPKVA
jgi:hypothetical protein